MRGMSGRRAAQGAAVNMKRGVSLSFRRPGQPAPRTAAGTINKGMTYMQIAASRNRAQSYVPGIVAYAKAEAGLRAADGAGHAAHIAERKAKGVKKVKEKKKATPPPLRRCLPSALWSSPRRRSRFWATTTRARSTSVARTVRPNS